MPASSPSSLAPEGPLGDMGGRVREPALSVALWLSWGAALGAVACAMALLTQQTELQILRRELSRLQRTGGPFENGEGYPWLSLQEQVSEGKRVSVRGVVARLSLAFLVPASCKVFSGCKRGSQVWRSREQPYQEGKLLKINASRTYQILEGSQHHDSGCWGKVHERWEAFLGQREGWEERLSGTLSP